ncbi:MAG: tyrosine-type recombinase/integrase [bacterium]
MKSNYSIKSFIMSNGERYCLLVDLGVPLFYPNLYMTTQVRNRSLSYSAMETSLTGISILLEFMRERNQLINERFKKGLFLDLNEIDALRDHCQLMIRTKTNPHNSKIFLSKKYFKEQNRMVSSRTEYHRLTVIAHYVEWLAVYLSENNHTAEQRKLIEKMVRAIKSRRPLRKSRNQELSDKGLSEKQLELLFELFRPESDLNPFKDKSVRIRNRLIFLMLYYLGLRGGELLNIRIRDIDFSNGQLVIARRADEKDDPRTDQPLVKTLDRRMPMKESLVKEIHNYILNERKYIPNAKKHDFLFVTHKAGLTCGQPISKSSYNKIIHIIRNVSPILYGFTGHSLRHTWNERFSNLMDQMNEPPDEARQEQTRSYLMGWREGSGTAATYNKRFIKRKAQEVAVELQKSNIRMPKNK